MTLRSIRPADAPRALAMLAMAGWSALALATASLPARAQNGDAVLAKVNGVEIHQSDITAAEEELGNLPAMDEATKRDTLIGYVIDMKLVAKTGEDRKLADSADFKRRLGFARDRLLMDRVLGDEAKTAVTEAAMRKVYDEAVKQIGNELEVHARHILVESEDEAKQILAELKKGTDFADLAKKKSKDPGAADGGDLGFFTKEQMVPEFSSVAFKLEPGQLSDPVKSQFGWHIIKVEEKRTRKAPEFEQVKAEIENYVRRKAQAEFVAGLRAAAKIERLDKKSDDAKPGEAKPGEAKPADKGAAPAKK
ncbi:MAG: peptidylprolyl isomerase [Xanthobacteraceae bacterium]|nr:MAG: peptidylprolyl isomerase [Xanthobacteraceae bacterium]